MDREDASACAGYPRLNTGIVYAPSLWLPTSWSDPTVNTSDIVVYPIVESVFNASYFDGVTLER